MSPPPILTRYEVVTWKAGIDLLLVADIASSGGPSYQTPLPSSPSLHSQSLNWCTLSYYLIPRQPPSFVPALLRRGAIAGPSGEGPAEVMLPLAGLGP